MDGENVTLLDDFAVAAIRGEGVCIVDESGNYWRVGEPTDGQEEANKLGRAYADAVAGEDG